MASRTAPSVIRSDLGRGPRLDVEAKDAGRAGDDLLQVFGRIKIEPVDDAEAVAERRGQEPRPGRGAHEREPGQVELDGAGAGALADDDVELEVLHRGIQDLLDDAVQAVDLVDEQDVARLEVRKDGGEVAGPLEHGARRRLDPHAHRMGNDVRERRFAQAGGSAEQHVVERLAPLTGRLDEHGKIVLDAVLADEVLEPRRPQAPVDLQIVIVRFCRHCAFGRSHAAPLPSGAPDGHRPGPAGPSAGT
jgi:hypothetical protein